MLLSHAKKFQSKVIPNILILRTQITPMNLMSLLNNNKFLAPVESRLAAGVVRIAVEEIVPHHVQLVLPHQLRELARYVWGACVHVNLMAIRGNAQ